MKGLIFAFLLFHSSLASAQGYGVWYFDDVEGDAEGRISACNAEWISATPGLWRVFSAKNWISYIIATTLPFRLVKSLGR